MRAVPGRAKGGEEAEGPPQLYRVASQAPARAQPRHPAAPPHDPGEAAAGCDLVEGYRLLQHQLIGLPTTLLLLLGLAQRGKLDDAVADASPTAVRTLEQHALVLKTVVDEWTTPQDTPSARLLCDQARRVLCDVPFTRRFLRAASTAFKEAATAGTSRLSPDLQATVLRGIGQGEARIQRGAHWLVVHHLWLVKCMAEDCRRLGLAEGDLLDIMQEGCLGLLSAADLFDVRKRVRFRTYATPWVRQAVGRYLRSRRLVAPPRAVQQMALKLRRTARRLEQLFDRELSPEELAAAAGVLPHDVIEAFAAQKAVLSLETPVNGGATLGDVLADPSASAFFATEAHERCGRDDSDEPDSTQDTGQRSSVG
jgi:RNA polymerase sigma factor (sigma-70 family)